MGNFGRLRKGLGGSVLSHKIARSSAGMRLGVFDLAKRGRNGLGRGAGLGSGMRATGAARLGAGP